MLHNVQRQVRTGKISAITLLSIWASSQSQAATATNNSGAMIANTVQMILSNSTRPADKPSLGTFKWSAFHVHMIVVEMQVYNSDDVPRVTGSLTQPTLFGFCVVIVPHLLSSDGASRSIAICDRLRQFGLYKQSTSDGSTVSIRQHVVWRSNACCVVECSRLQLKAEIRGCAKSWMPMNSISCLSTTFPTFKK